MLTTASARGHQCSSCSVSKITRKETMKFQKVHVSVWVPFVLVLMLQACRLVASGSLCQYSCPLSRLDIIAISGITGAALRRGQAPRVGEMVDSLNTSHGCQELHIGRWLGLDMSHNHLTALPDHLFNFTCRLRLASLNLSHNNLHTLSPGVLTPVSNLRRLDLTFNRLRWLRAGSFPVSLQCLDVSHNVLITLEPGLFSHHHHLTTIHMAHNQIHTIHPTVFHTGMYTVQSVDFSYNRLTTFEPWPYFFSQLFCVDLSHNRISRFANTLNFTLEREFNLAEVNLTHNSITSITPEDFGLYYEARVPSTIQIRNLWLDLRFNPWRCDCGLHALIDMLRDSFLKLYTFDGLVFACHSPPSLRGRSLGFLIDHPGLLTCDVKEDCPEGCRCVDTPHEGHVVISCDPQLHTYTHLPQRLPASGWLSLNLSRHELKVLGDDGSDVGELRVLDVSRNQIRQVLASFLDKAKHLQVLNLRHNQLTSLPSELKRLSLHNLHAEGNPLECSCDLEWFGEWVRASLHSNKSHSNAQQSVQSAWQPVHTLPSGPSRASLAPPHDGASLICTRSDGRVVGVVDMPQWSVYCGPPVSVLVLVVCGVLLLGVLVGTGVCWRWRYNVRVMTRYMRQRVCCCDVSRTDDIEMIQLKNALAETSVKYDVYVSLDEEDDVGVAWTKHWLLPLLERKGGHFFRVYLPLRQEPVGACKAESRAEAINQSSKVLVVLSPGYASNSWCRYELDQACWCLEQHRHNSLVIILVDNAWGHPDLTGDHGPPMGAARDCGLTVGAAGDCGPPVGAARDCGPPMGAARDCGPPVGAAGDCSSPVGAAKDCGPPVGAARDCGPPLGASRDCSPPVGAARDCSPPVGAARDRGPSMGTARVGGSPVGTVRDGGSPVGTARDGGSPVGTARDGGSPVGTARDGGSPVSTVRDRGSPVGTAGDGCPPVGTARDGSSPVDTVRDGGSPVGTVRDGGSPVGTVRDGGSPVSTVRDGGSPVSTVRDDAPPVGTVRDGDPPVGTARDDGPPVGTARDGGPPVGAVGDEGQPVGIAGDGGPSVSTTIDGSLRVGAARNCGSAVCTTRDYDPVKIMTAKEYNPSMGKARDYGLAVGMTGDCGPAVDVAREPKHAVGTARDCGPAPGTTRNCGHAEGTARDCDCAVSIARDRDRAVSIARDCDRAVSIARDRDHAVDLARDCGPAVDIVRDCGHAVGIARDRGRAVGISKHCGHAVDMVRHCSHAVDMAGDCGRAVGIAGDCGHAVGIARGYVRALGIGGDCNPTEDIIADIAPTISNARGHSLCVDTGRDCFQVVGMARGSQPLEGITGDSILPVDTEGECGCLSTTKDCNRTGSRCGKCVQVLSFARDCSHAVGSARDDSTAKDHSVVPSSDDNSRRHTCHVHACHIDSEPLSSHSNDHNDVYNRVHHALKVQVHAEWENSGTVVLDSTKTEMGRKTSQMIRERSEPDWSHMQHNVLGPVAGLVNADLVYCDRSVPVTGWTDALTGPNTNEVTGERENEFSMESRGPSIHKGISVETRSHLTPTRLVHADRTQTARDHEVLTMNMAAGDMKEVSRGSDEDLVANRKDLHVNASNATLDRTNDERTEINAMLSKAGKDITEANIILDRAADDVSETYATVDRASDIVTETMLDSTSDVTEASPMLGRASDETEAMLDRTVGDMAEARATLDRASDVTEAMLGRTIKERAEACVTLDRASDVTEAMLDRKVGDMAEARVTLDRASDVTEAMLDRKVGDMAEARVTLDRASDVTEAMLDRTVRDMAEARVTLDRASDVTEAMLDRTVGDMAEASVTLDRASDVTEAMLDRTVGDMAEARVTLDRASDVTEAMLDRTGEETVGDNVTLVRASDSVVEANVMLDRANDNVTEAMLDRTVENKAEANVTLEIASDDVAEASVKLDSTADEVTEANAMLGRTTDDITESSAFLDRTVAASLEEQQHAVSRNTGWNIPEQTNNRQSTKRNVADAKTHARQTLHSTAVQSGQRHPGDDGTLVQEKQNHSHIDNNHRPNVRSDNHILINSSISSHSHTNNYDRIDVHGHCSSHNHVSTKADSHIRVKKHADNTKKHVSGSVDSKGLASSHKHTDNRVTPRRQGGKRRERRLEQVREASQYQEGGQVVVMQPLRSFLLEGRYLPLSDRLLKYKLLFELGNRIPVHEDTGAT